MTEINTTRTDQSPEAQRVQRVEIENKKLLPDELKLRIFGLLDGRSLISATRTCKRFYNIISNEKSLSQKMKMEHYNHLSEEILFMHSYKITLRGNALLSALEDDQELSLEDKISRMEKWKKEANYMIFFSKFQKELQEKYRGRFNLSITKDNINECREVLKNYNLSEILELDFSGSGLTELPPEIGYFSNLETLLVGCNYTGNKITKIPSEIGNLTKLKKLDFRGNIITKIPSEIGNLTKLEELDVSYNMITKIPSEIGNLLNLVELDVSGNRLVSLPENIIALKNLNKINIRYNKELKLPDALQKHFTKNKMLSARKTIQNVLAKKYSSIKRPARH